MDPKIIFWLVFAALTALVLFLNAKYGMLRDESILEKKKPYSYARTQLTWWTIIVLSSFMTIILSRNEIPTLTQGILILLGISSATTITARITDISDQTNIDPDKIVQNTKGENFLIDILSDKNGVSIHRLQAVLFNIVIGFWFIHESLTNIVKPGLNMDKILPDIELNNLILMGLSAGTYVALKTSENKKTSGNNPDTSSGKEDEMNENEIPSIG
jgi:hypothetical protein